MHIEPGVVDGAKMVLAYGTAAGAAGYSAKLVMGDLARSNIASFAARTVLATVGVFAFFEILPHFPAGISEVHFILGTTLFLLLGAAPAALGLARRVAGSRARRCPGGGSFPAWIPKAGSLPRLRGRVGVGQWPDDRRKKEAARLGPAFPGAGNGDGVRRAAIDPG